MVLLTALPASAAERSVGDVVLVDQGTVIDDDLYAAGNRVVVDGRVEGDLVAAAYEDLTVTGRVAGDVVVLAGSVDVSGEVGESLRAVSPEVDVSGSVGGDVILVAADADITGAVGGDSVTWAWRAEMAGTVEGDLEGQMRRLTLMGRVARDVDVTVGRLVVGEEATVGRDLGYRSDQDARGVDQAQVGGAVVHRLPLPPNIRVRALLVLAKLVMGLMAAVAGLLVIWALPTAAERAMAGVHRSWWRSWLRGLVVIALPPAVLALGALLLTTAPTQAGLPLLGVLTPLFLAVVGVVMALALLAPVAAFPWLGRTGNRERGPVRAFLYGAALVIAGSLLPGVVWAIALFVIPLGIGGWLSLRPSAPAG